MSRRTSNHIYLNSLGFIYFWQAKLFVQKELNNLCHLIVKYQHIVTPNLGIKFVKEKKNLFYNNSEISGTSIFSNTIMKYTQPNFVL